jgi:2-(1,2-epoxy-1,2-dihydrophenyl)acetyl-CoA isomerase
MLNRVIEADAFMDTTQKFAARLAAGPAAALAQTKVGVQLGQKSSLADVFDFEKRTQTRLFLEDDAREGMRAFVEKRAPKFG